MIGLFVRASSLLAFIIVTPAPAAPPLPPFFDSSLSGNGEPITAIPEPDPSKAQKVALGERLFKDVRLSRGHGRSCASCHQIDSNGASAREFDSALDGERLPLNTPTVFNAALSFRLTWEGTLRTLEEQVLGSLVSPEIMGANLDDIVQELEADSALAAEFRAVYGRGADADAIADAIASFERSLLTPASRFDRWLEGEADALTPLERRGYRLFKSLGCVSCHQGVNIGGNLFQRHGIFHPLASAEPAILRVPSLRNIAVTPPYFHDGSAATLEEAVRRMAVAQLNSILKDAEVEAVAAFLKTLTGNYRGRMLKVPN